MEFPHGGRRERFYITQQEEDRKEEATRRISFIPSPSTLASSSSSSASAAAAFRWPNDGSSGAGGCAPTEKEHMFDKVVTPSDVGKLNRLVIPKQHAERYFPLDASANEKGLLLCFEDRTGKAWRFRYSYWNSSQSYVMTKGWSRFVKEKRLDAGDTVSFGRGVGEASRDRFFIDWKRRPEPREPPRLSRFPLPGVGLMSFAQSSSIGPWNGRLFVPPTTSMYSRNVASSSTGGGNLLYFGRPAAAAMPPQIGVQTGGGPPLPMVLDAVPVIQNQAATTSKRFRLFGVNLDCPQEPERGNVLTGSAVLQLLQPRPTELPLLRSPPRESTESSAASSTPSQSKEHPSSLDLDL